MTSSKKISVSMASYRRGVCFPFPNSWLIWKCFLFENVAQECAQEPARQLGYSLHLPDSHTLCGLATNQLASGEQVEEVVLV